MQHVPVMAGEVVHYLLHDRSRVVLDGTVGYGGHAEAILRASDAVRLIGVDRDPEAIEGAARRLHGFADRVTLVQGHYSDLGPALAGVGMVDGVLLDLGVSSPQIDDARRGFAHGASGPLDMRMGRGGETAAELLARLNADELARLLKNLGEVRQPRRVARAIRAAVERGEMRTTADLRNAVTGVLGRGAPPAELSRVFQAVRIAVNAELEHLRRFLDGVLAALRPGGRLVVLSYHSLEDRMVKEFMRDAARECVCPPGVPVCVCGRAPALRLLTRKAVRAGEAETRANPRARSAVLRAAEKLNGRRAS
ncbi:MAG TPA: 16S rRNA (cytosine(1402)-N(4))-methyltransferase RsmH [Candidatus Krumholzibacteria bacterium]|nr:16S rRNA (cytosine(1402)-N(4))-methyltransferase RsmH [Candidatus Krumholzibacteria bacterium]